MGVELTTLPPKKHTVKEISKQPRNWILNGKQLESKNGLPLGIWNVKTLNKFGALEYVHDTYNYTIDILTVREIRWPKS